VWEQILGIIDKLTPSLLALIGVYLGWALNSRSQKKLTQLELLESTFNSFREVRSLVDNIPPDLDEAALIEKLRDDKFKKNLSGRLVRLFGLRTELIPSLHAHFVDFIDNKFRYLYEIETGSYELRSDRINNFANACIELRTITLKVEKELNKNYEKLKN